MALINKILAALLFIMLSYSTTAQAQVLGLGGSFNHISSGVNLFYSKISQNQKWEYDAGLRVAVNAVSLNKNTEGYTFYKNGYSDNFPQHFSLNFRVSRKLASYKPLSLYGMSNLHIAFQSILERFNNYDTLTGTYSSYDLLYYKSSPSLELALGLLLQVKLSSKVNMFMASGVGFIYLHHRHEGWNRTRNAHVRVVYFTRTSPFKHRGAGNFIGFDGLPYLSAGVRYRLK